MDIFPEGAEIRLFQVTVNILIPERVIAVVFQRVMLLLEPADCVHHIRNPKFLRRSQERTQFTADFLRFRLGNGSQAEDAPDPFCIVIRPVFSPEGNRYVRRPAEPDLVIVFPGSQPEVPDIYHLACNQQHGVHKRGQPEQGGLQFFFHLKAEKFCMVFHDSLSSR